MGATVTWRSLAPLVLAFFIGHPSQAQAPCEQARVGQPFSLSPILQQPGESLGVPAKDYRQRLQTTSLGWPLQSTWCVWVEPATADQRWQQAISLALKEWKQVLPIVEVLDQRMAQVIVRRQRPPLGLDGAGRSRASNGRAILSLQRLGGEASGVVEPRVEVLINPGQRLEAIQATALHELGHAFGLWGHSEDPGDAMAPSAGASPVLRLSERDRSTVRWLYSQPTRLRSEP